MLLPNKYEDINKNLLVLGGDIIGKLKKRTYNIEELYQVLKEEKSINIEQYYNTLTFLWLSDILTVETYLINLNNTK